MAEPTITNAAGITRITLGAAVSCKVGDLLGHDGTNWVLADADARVPARFMALETVTAGSSVAVCESGVLFDSDAPYTVGASQYLSATAGAHGAIPGASATLTLLQRIGHAIATDTMAFNLARVRPDLMRVQVTYDPASLAATTARNDTVAVTGLQTTDLIRGGSVANVALEAGLVISMVDVSAADTIRFCLHNPTAGTIDGASLVHTVLVERP
jgi:hypothetical protein